VEPEIEWPNDPRWRAVEVITKDGRIENHVVFAANNRDAFLQVVGDRLHEVKELWAESVEEDR
jgi:hypothetical protein